MGRIIRSHNVCFHCFADDTELYLSFNPNIPGEAETAIYRLQQCISDDVRCCMTCNKLKLNNDKTEFFIAGTQQNINKLPELKLKVGSCLIKPSNNVRNLGIVFDTNMTMSKQINSLISSGNYHLRNMYRIGRYLDQETRHSILRALLLSRLDYGNALLYGANSTDLIRLQSLQNRAAKFIFSASRLDSPKPLLNKLHWLPIHKRIHFKICLYVFKCLNGTAPVYLTTLLQRKTHPLTGPVTRSAADESLLLVPFTKRRAGDRSFSAAGPYLWNALPSHIRNSTSLAIFKKKLKSHLFI